MMKCQHLADLMGSLCLHSRAVICRAGAGEASNRTGWCAGAAEAVFAIKALHSGLGPPLLNLWKQWPPRLAGLTGKTPVQLPKGPRAVMSNSFGFGGASSSLIFTSPPQIDDWDV